MNKMNDKPRILTYDIETFPATGYFWNKKWETNIIEILEQSPILSFSAKWLHGKQITKSLPDYRGYRKGTKDDSNLIKDIWDVLDEADVVVMQNGQAYDYKMTNARFLYHGLTAPSPYKIIDTLKEARKYIKLPSYSLDDMVKYFSIGKKKEHEGFDLWTKCLSGDKSAWNRMKAYNAHDVLITEKLYLKLMPFAQSNLGIYYNSNIVCANCGSENIQSRGYAVNKTTKYRRFQCLSCSSWGRSTMNIQEMKPLVSI